MGIVYCHTLFFFFQFSATKEQLKSAYLWITVWNHEVLQHNQFLGETGICFDLYDLDKPIKKQLYKLKLYDFANTALPDDPTTKIVKYRATPKMPMPVPEEEPAAVVETTDAGDNSQTDTQQVQPEENNDARQEPPEVPIADAPDTAKLETEDSVAVTAPDQPPSVETVPIQDETMTTDVENTQHHPSIPTIEVEHALTPVPEREGEPDIAEPAPAIPKIEVEPASDVPIEAQPTPGTPKIKVTSVDSAPTKLPPQLGSQLGPTQESVPPKKPPRAKKKKAKKYIPPNISASDSNRFVVIAASTRPSRQAKYQPNKSQ